MNIVISLKSSVQNAFSSLYSRQINEEEILIQKTRKEFSGDFTINVFPFLKISKKSPEVTANEIGNFLKENVPEISGFNVIKRQYS